MRIGSSARARGFTLIEMVVVISLILVLLSISLPMYSRYIIKSKEARLHSDLATLNKVIEAYSFDKRHAPQTLDDLIQAGYLRFIPEDITGRSDTWVLEAEDPQKAFDANQPGIAFVRSGSNEMSSDGVSTYSSWVK